jgi:hypothetical protein
VKKRPELRDKNTKPSEKNWEWDNCYFLDLRAASEDNIEWFIFYKSLMLYMPQELASVYLEKIKTHIDCKKEILEIYRQNNAFSEFKTLFEFTMGADGKKVFGCWGPTLIPLPENPLKMLLLKRGSKQLPKDDEKEYEHYYVVLSSIHDNLLPEEQISFDIWPADLAKAVWDCLDEYYVDRIEFFKCALDRIKKANGGKAGGTTQATPETAQKNKNTIKERAGELTPKPPEILQKILWVWRYWRVYWKLILLAASILLFLLVAKWLLVPYINSRIRPVDNPSRQATRMPQTPHRSIKPTQILKEPVVSKPQLIGIPVLVNEPNKGGRDTNDKKKIAGGEGRQFN